MPRITPDWEPHSQLEADIKLYAECSGFYTFDLTYHSTLDDELKELVSYTFTPTILHIRGKSDRIAIHYDLPIGFKWEAKTHESSQYHDMTIEALPMVQHIRNCEMDIKCLYCYRSPYDKRDYGFWVEEMPSPKIIMIPTRRWSEWGIDYFRSVLKLVFEEKDIIDIASSRGSGDPFLIIDKAEKIKMRDWKDLIDEELIKADET